MLMAMMLQKNQLSSNGNGLQDFMNIFLDSGWGRWRTKQRHKAKWNFRCSFSLKKIKCYIFEFKVFTESAISWKFQSVAERMTLLLFEINVHICLMSTALHVDWQKENSNPVFSSHSKWKLEHWPHIKSPCEDAPKNEWGRIILIASH